MTNLKKNLFEQRYSVILLAVLCTLLWGSAFPGIKISYGYFNIESDSIGQTMLIAGIRFTMAGLMTMAVYFISVGHVVLPEKSNIKGILIAGSVQTALQYLFFYTALSHLTGAKGAILAATITFFSVFLSHIIFPDDKMNGKKLIGCLIGFAGIIIINLKGGGELGGFRLLGDGIMLLSTFSAAAGAMISKIVAKKVNPVMLTGYQMTFGGIVLLIVGIVAGGKLNTSSTQGCIILIYLAFVSAVAFSIWTTLLKYNQPSKIAVFNFAIPIFGTILSALFLGEQIISFQNFLALLCVCMGIYIVNKI